MTRYLLVAAVTLAVFGCDSNSPTDTDSLEDLFSANKQLTESVIDRRNSYCISNPTYSKCEHWCLSPEADCGEGSNPVEEDEVTADFNANTDDLTVSFTNESENADYYLWDFGDGTKSGTENPTHTYAEAGDYTVSLTATGNEESASVAKEVSVNADDPGDPTDPVPPVASFTFNANDLSVSFANSSQHDDNSSWNFGDGNSSSDENPSHTYASAGSYQVTLEVTNADGSDSVTETVTVEAPDPDPVPPVASFSYSVSDLSVSFSNNSQNASSNTWDFGDGNTSSDTNPNHTYGSAGTYTVTLEVANADGSDSEVQSVTVTASDPGPVGPDEIPSDRTDLGGAGWNSDLPNVPSGIIVFTGYSNSSQHANTFINSYANSYNNYTFVNCALGSNALENWVSKNLAASCDVPGGNENVVLTVNMVASQFAMTAAESSESIASNVPQLDAQLRSAFPNAIHAYYGGEPAHWVEPSKCPRICEPIRKLASDWAAAAARSVGSYLGPYIWAGDGIANAHGVVYNVNDFLNPTGDGYANQHPSTAGREKVSAQYDTWFRENGIN